ncbi:MAG: RHS repeat-associated core domain-containing protein, partial [Anaerolineales bacterium]|nr:RHS repeat-associated core domain-containing protein [Anaerolineales bacterium]
SGQPSAFSFAYNGLGDRLQQAVDGVPTNYTLDINRGLTQVLADGTNTYLYGPSTGSGQGLRIGEEQPGGWQYHHGDALGSVRQLTNDSAAVSLTRAYKPFGSTLTSTGSASTNYAFTGEWADGTGLVYLRARYLDPAQGRFFQPDPWPGDTLRPQSLNGYPYVVNNPVTWVDPSGRCYGAMKYLREIEPVSCNNMDLSNIIIANPNASFEQKAAAWAYQYAFTASHASVMVGAAVAAPAWAAGGALVGGGYAGLQDTLARSGACGCEAQQAAQQSDLWGAIGQGATLGLAGGGVGGGVSGLHALAQLGVGAVGTGGSALGLYDAGRDFLENGPNWCNAIQGGLSAVGVVGSAAFARQGFGQFVDESLRGLSGFGVPDELAVGSQSLPWTSWSQYPKVQAGGRTYAQIGGRLYTRHAVERMMPRGLTGEGRSISPTFVETVIQNGTSEEVIVNGVTRTIHTLGTV